MKNTWLVVIPTLALGLGLMFLPGCSKGVQEGAPPSVSDAARQVNPEPASTQAGSTGTPAPVAPSGAATTGDPTVIAFHGLTAPKPESWVIGPIESSMQTVLYVVPGPEGAEPAKLTVYFFGTGMGGTIEANITRWAGQVMTAEGAPSEPKTEAFETAGGLPVTLVELHGFYQGMGMPEPMPDQLFLAAIVESSIGRIFIRLVGPAATVEANRQAYLDMINGLKAG